MLSKLHDDPNNELQRKLSRDKTKKFFFFQSKKTLPGLKKAAQLFRSGKLGNHFYQVTNASKFYLSGVTLAPHAEFAAS